MASSSPPSKRRRTNQGKDDAGDTSSPPSSTLEQLSPVVVFAHGAGAPSSSDWMIRFCFFLSLIYHFLSRLYPCLCFMSLWAVVCLHEPAKIAFLVQLVKSISVNYLAYLFIYCWHGFLLFGLE